jgi:NAD dependent epimerase/dehydratase family enzyme
MENEKMEGVYNVVAPHPVSNKELVLEIARMKEADFTFPFMFPLLL